MFESETSEPTVIGALHRTDVLTDSPGQLSSYFCHALLRNFYRTQMFLTYLHSLTQDQLSAITLDIVLPVVPEGHRHAHGPAREDIELSLNLAEGNRSTR